MQLMRIGAQGAEHPALPADDGTILDLSDLTAFGLPGTPYLRPDDPVELEITGPGAQTQLLAEA